MRFIVLPLAVALLAGCGNERTPPPNIDDPVAPAETERTRIGGTGISFRAPVNWQEVTPVGSLVGGVRSKSATVAVWRYPRSETLPEDPVALDAARDRLVERIEEADPTLRLRRTRLRPSGIELVGRQTMAGVPHAFRSLHVFADGAEVVVDAYALPEDFRRVDRTVFKPLVDSLRIR